MTRFLSALNAHRTRRWRVKRSRFWLVKALCLAAVVLFVPQVAWASAYGAGSLVRVSGTSPFAGSNCGLAGQTGKTSSTARSNPSLTSAPRMGTTSSACGSRIAGRAALRAATWWARASTMAERGR